ncbi:hypothetical protein HZB02_02270 [Candidatus Woesearchaeota archaeon]|nr:hypothetical protein [Candidatus Woesearchaeota archaeon]
MEGSWLSTAATSNRRANGCNARISSAAGEEHEGFTDEKLDDWICISCFKKHEKELM